jgi:hypothetical protein
LECVSCRHLQEYWAISIRILRFAEVTYLGLHIFTYHIFVGVKNHFLIEYSVMLFPFVNNDFFRIQDRFENGDFNNQTDIDFPDQLQQQLDEEEHQQRLSAALAQEEFRPAGEVFQDPSDLDFLMQHGGSSKDIALARQSLFVKFDPLVQGRPSLFPTQSDASG